MLDACVFKPNIRAGTIAHRLEDAQAIFRDKIKFPYDNLPDPIRAAVPIIKDSVTGFCWPTIRASESAPHIDLAP